MYSIPEIYFTLQRAFGNGILNGSRPFISFEVVNYIHNGLVLNHISLPSPYLLMTPVLTISIFIFGPKKVGYAKEKSKCGYGLQVSKWPRPAIFAFYIYF